MAELVLSLGGALLSTLSKAMELWEQKQMNEEIQGELEQFVRELQYNITHLQEKSMGSRCSNITSWALDALQKDLEIADLDAKNILNKGFLKSIWDANKTRSRLEALRERVMTSFQTRLILALLDVAVESQQGQEVFQNAMLNMNKELVESYSSKANQSLKKSMQDVIRKELQVMLNPLMLAIQSDGRRDVETTMSMIRNTSAQTSETEKFFADVLAGLEDVLQQSRLSKKDEDSRVLVKWKNIDSKMKPNNDGPKWYQDPITWETMCDPVKANDGYTYDRWTILRHPSSMIRSPFVRDEKHPFLIERDDISIRSHLFQKFPNQVAKFKAERVAYRKAALQALKNGNFGESLIMLNHVLEWDPQDVECSNMRDHVQCQLDGNLLGTNLWLEALVQELGIGNKNSTSASSSSSVQAQEVEDGYAPSLIKGNLIQSVISVGKKGNGTNPNFGERDESARMGPEHFDRSNVDNEVVLSADGLMATSTSSSSSIEVQDGFAPSLTKGKSTNSGNDSGNHHFVEKDESVEMGPERFDISSVDNEAVVLSADGLVATYKLAEGPGATVVANVPCPSDCYPFYFEVLVHPSSNDCEQDVAIGFSIAAVARGGLGTYSGSCGYYALQGKVSYLGASSTPGPNASVDVRYPIANASAISRRKRGYVVGAGFHICTGIVFFMLDRNVVALLEAAHFSCGHPSQMFFPAVSLHCHGAKVKANFGPTNWVLSEPWLSSFDVEETASTRLHIPEGSTTCAVMTKQAVPMRTNVFYFEIFYEYKTLKLSCLPTVSLGFAGTSTFSKTAKPGTYNNSCGVAFWSDGSCRPIQNGKTEGTVIKYMKEDESRSSYRVGVGIHYGTNEIFFTIDGCFLYSVRNRLQWPVNAVVAITSYPLLVKGGTEMDISWLTGVGHLNWVRLPKKLQHSLCSTPKFMTTLDPQGLQARHTGFVIEPNNINDTSQYSGVAAFRADVVVPLQSNALDTSTKPFYFELMVADKGQNGYIAIGFSHFQHFKDSQQLGCYNYSCAYHGNTGKLFSGTHTGKEFGPTFSTGDRVGAGFNHHTNTIFFVKNGKIVGRTRNNMGSCALYPAVGLGSNGAEVHLNFLGFENPFRKIAGDSADNTVSERPSLLPASGCLPFIL